MRWRRQREMESWTFSLENQDLYPHDCFYLTWLGVSALLFESRNKLLAARKSWSLAAEHHSIDSDSWRFHKDELLSSIPKAKRWLFAKLSSFELSGDDICECLDLASPCFVPLCRRCIGLTFISRMDKLELPQLLGLVKTPRLISSKYLFVIERRSKRWTCHVKSFVQIKPSTLFPLYKGGYTNGLPPPLGRSLFQPFAIVIDTLLGIRWMTSRARTLDQRDQSDMDSTTD